MADAYNVTSYTDHTITLKKVGLHLGPSTTVIQRAQIASVRQVPGRVVVATTDGRSYKVQAGIRAEQRDLVRTAFGL